MIEGWRAVFDDEKVNTVSFSGDIASELDDQVVDVILPAICLCKVVDCKVQSLHETFRRAWDNNC